MAAASLKELQSMAREVGAALTVSSFAQGRCHTRPRNAGELREAIISCTCGPWGKRTFPSVAHLDDTLRQLVAVRRGDYGERLSKLAYHSRWGLYAVNELARLQGLKRRSPAREAEQAAEIEKHALAARKYREPEQ